MSDKYFLDTNIFVYAFDSTDSQKQSKANDVIKSALADHSGCISYQVMQEFLNVVTRKFAVPLSIPDCEKYLNTVLSPLSEVYASTDRYLQSLDILERWQFSFYDSLIISAALQSNCKILHTEDLQHQQKIQGLTICNPFV